MLISITINWFAIPFFYKFAINVEHVSHKQLVVLDKLLEAGRKNTFLQSQHMRRINTG